MRGLFDKIFKSYNETQALYQQAARNVLMAKDADKDKIAVAQIARLQQLTPAKTATAVPVATPSGTVVSRAVDYAPYALAAGAALGFLIWWMKRGRT